MRFTKCLLSCQDNPALFFSFDVEGELSITRTLTVSSKWNEAGFAVAQAAASEPIEVSLSGKIGYLAAGDTLLDKYNELLDKAQNRLSIVQGTYAGGLIASQLKTVQKAVNTAQTAVSAVDNFATKIKKELDAYNGADRLLKLKEDLRSIYAMKMLVKINAPLETLENMLIESMAINYPDKTDQTLDISLSLKEVRFAKIKTSNLDKALFSQQMCRADIGMSAAEDGGVASVGDKPAEALKDNRTTLQRAGGNWDAAINGGFR